MKHYVPAECVSGPRFKVKVIHSVEVDESTWRKECSRTPHAEIQSYTGSSLSYTSLRMRELRKCSKLLLLKLKPQTYYARCPF